jgi:hypothetical protein
MDFAAAAARGAILKARQQQQAPSKRKNENDDTGKDAKLENPPKRQKISDSKDTKKPLPPPPPKAAVSSSSSKPGPKAAASKPKAVDDKSAVIEKLYFSVLQWEASGSPLYFDLLLMLYILWELPVSGRKRIPSMKSALAKWMKITEASTSKTDGAQKRQVIKRIYKVDRVKQLKLVFERFVTEQNALDIEGKQSGPLMKLVAGYKKGWFMDPLDEIIRAVRQRGFATGNLAVICLDLEPLNEQIKSRRHAISEQQLLAYTFYLGFQNTQSSELFKHSRAAKIAALVDYSGCLGLPVLICADAFMGPNNSSAIPSPKSKTRKVLDFLYKDVKGTITSLPHVYETQVAKKKSSSSNSSNNGNNEATEQLVRAAKMACSYTPLLLRLLCDRVQKLTSQSRGFSLNQKDIILEDARPRTFFVVCLVGWIIRPSATSRIRETIDRLVSGFYNTKRSTSADLKTAEHMIPLKTVEPRTIYQDLAAASRWNSWCQCVNLLQELEGKESKAMDTEAVTQARALRIQVGGMEFVKVRGSTSEPLSVPVPDTLDPTVTTATVSKKILIDNLLASSRDETTVSPVTWWTAPAASAGQPPLAMPTFCCKYTDGKWIHLTPTDMSVLLLIQAWEFDILLDTSLKNSAATADTLLKIAKKPSFLRRMKRTIDLHLQKTAQARGRDAGDEANERVLDHRVYEHVESMRLVLEEEDRKAARLAPPTIILNPGGPGDHLHDWSKKFQNAVLPQTIPYCIRLLEAIRKGNVPIPVPDAIKDSKESNTIVASIVTLVAVSRSMAQTDELAKNASGSASIKRISAMQTGNDSDEEELEAEGEEEEDEEEGDDESQISSAIAALKSRANQSIAVSKTLAPGAALDAVHFLSKEVGRRNRRAKNAAHVVKELQTKLSESKISLIDQETIKAKIERLLEQQKNEADHAKNMQLDRIQFEKELDAQSNPAVLEEQFAKMDDDAGNDKAPAGVEDSAKETEVVLMTRDEAGDDAELSDFSDGEEVKDETGKGEDEGDDMKDDEVLRDQRDREAKEKEASDEETRNEISQAPPLRTILEYIDYLGLSMRPHGQLASEADTGLELYIDRIRQPFGSLVQDSKAQELLNSLKIPSAISTLKSGILFTRSSESGAAVASEFRNKLICAILVSRGRLERRLAADVAPVESTAPNESKEAAKTRGELNAQLQRIRQFNPGFLPSLPVQTADHIDDPDTLLHDAVTIRDEANRKRESWLSYLFKKEKKAQSNEEEEEEEQDGDTMQDDKTLSAYVDVAMLENEIKANTEDFRKNAAAGASYTAWTQTTQSALQDDDDDEERRSANPFSPSWFLDALEEMNTVRNGGFFVPVEAPDSGDAKRFALLPMDKREQGRLDAIEYGMTHATVPEEKAGTTVIALENRECITLMQRIVLEWAQGDAERALRFGVERFIKHSKGEGLLSEDTAKVALNVIRAGINTRSDEWRQSAQMLARKIETHRVALTTEGKEKKKKDDNLDTSDAWSRIFGSGETLTNAILGMDIDYFRARLADEPPASVAEFLVAVSTYNRDRYRWYSFVEAAVDYISNLNSALLFGTHALWLRKFRFETNPAAKKALWDVIDEGWAIKKLQIGNRDTILAYANIIHPDYARVEATIDGIVKGEFKSCMQICAQSAEIINSDSEGALAATTLHLDLDVDVQNLVTMPPELLLNDRFTESAYGTVLETKEEGPKDLVNLVIRILNSPVVDKKDGLAALNKMRRQIGYDNIADALEYRVMAFMMMMMATTETKSKETKAVNLEEFKRTEMDESSDSNSSSSDSRGVVYRNKLIPLHWEQFIPGIDKTSDPWWNIRVVTLRSLARWIRTGVTNLFEESTRNSGKLLPGRDVLWRQLHHAYDVFNALSSNPSSDAWNSEALATHQRHLIDTFFTYSSSSVVEQKAVPELGQLETTIKSLLLEQMKTGTAVMRIYPVFATQLNPNTLDTGDLMQSQMVDYSVIQRVVGVLEEIGVVSADRNKVVPPPPEQTDLSVSVYSLFGKEPVNTQVETYFSQLRQAFGIAPAADEPVPLIKKKKRLFKLSDDDAMQTSGKLSGDKLLQMFARNPRKEDADVDSLTGQLQTLQVVDDGDRVVLDYKQLDVVAFVEPRGRGDGMSLRDYAYDQG